MNKPKLYVVRKYVRAHSVTEAIRKAAKSPVDDCWVDDDWKKGQISELANAVGFGVEAE